VGRATLRRILSHYTGIAPAALAFTYNAFGKPALALDQNPASLEFNLSHTGDQALCAVTYGHAVGVDVEAIKELDYVQLAGTVFSAYEQATLQQLAPADQPLAFFNGWTRKEAYIKAHGKGLSMPLADFDVTLAPHEPVRLLATRPDPAEAARWSLFGWSIGATCVAALAVAGQDWQLVHRDLRELR
jgi:4'-phosphopantetheinyl transferase